MEDLIDVMGAIGQPAIAPIAAFIADEFNPTDLLITATDCLTQIGLRHPELRDECITVLRRELERFDENDPALNGFLVLGLAKLKATESLPLLKEVFDAEAVDELILNWDDVEVEFGFKEREGVVPLDSDDPFAYREPYPPSFEPEPYAVPFQPLSPKAAQKKKARLKQAKLSRKINRKKKK